MSFVVLNWKTQLWDAEPYIMSFSLTSTRSMEGEHLLTEKSPELVRTAILQLLSTQVKMMHFNIETEEGRKESRDSKEESAL